MKRALRIAGWTYLTGTILVAASLFVYHCKLLGMQCLAADLAVHDLVIGFFWPVHVVMIVLGMLGIITIE